jgi:A repeated domain in UCH-protein
VDLDDKLTSARAATLDPATRNMYVIEKSIQYFANIAYSYYSSLGVPQDASDELVSYAYREQIRTNAREGPIYLTYLRQIAEERRSELLETLVATQYSAGNFDSEQLNDAYRYFAFYPRDNGLTDDLILGTFQARLQDSSKHEADMRAHLRIIGTHRHSQRIKGVAEDGESFQGIILVIHSLCLNSTEYIRTSVGILRCGCNSQ